MKILIALAEGQEHRLQIAGFTMSFREAPLTTTTLAALVPPELNAEVTIADESVQPIPFDQEFDLVGVSVLTGTSTRAYEIADAFRAKGVTVVLGGIHVKLCPEEARAHADSIVIGFAEETWPELLRDFARGELKPEYVQTSVKITGLPLPRRDLQKKRGYGVSNTVYATRGCSARCEFCSVPAAGYGFHKRPVADVVDEIRGIKARRIAFNDVNLTDDKEYAKELMRAMIPMKKRWGGLASTRVVDDDELLGLLRDAGCRFLLLGFESVNAGSLRHIRKGFNKVKEYQEVVRKLHAHHIIILGCFIFGMEGEDKGVFDETVDFINEVKIDIPRYAVFTPYPGTPAFDRLKAQDRIIHQKWEYYDTQHVVFIPDRMTPRELDEGFKRAFRRTFTMGNTLRRSVASGRNAFISFMGNLAYRIYIRRLRRDPDRFPSGIEIPDHAFAPNWDGQGGIGGGVCSTGVEE